MCSARLLYGSLKKLLFHFHLQVYSLDSLFTGLINVWAVTDRCDWLVKFLALCASTWMRKQLFGSHMSVINYKVLMIQISVIQKEIDSPAVVSSEGRHLG